MDKQQFIREIQDVQEPLRRFLLVLCDGDPFTADDIAQDACVKAWIASDSFRGSSKLKTWIFKIAYNCWCDNRYSGRHAEDLNSSVARNVSNDDSADRAFEHQGLYKAIEELNPNEKAAIILFYMEDRDIKEISAILNIPIGSVKSLLSRGRAKLKIKLTSV